MQQLKAFFQHWFAGSSDEVSYESAQARVQRGAAYLDDVDPGWHWRVDPSVLELASGQSCVLGQLHGDFRLGLSRSRLLDLSSAPRASLSPVSFGFQCVSGVGEELQERDYELLNRAWRKAIRTRQAADTGGAVSVSVQESQDTKRRTPVEVA